MEPWGLAGAVGGYGMTGSRTEAVLLAALRAAAPTERAERSAERTNMLMARSRRRGEEVNWGAGGGGGGVGRPAGMGQVLRAQLQSANPSAQTGLVRAPSDWPSTRLHHIIILGAVRGLSTEEVNP